MKALTTATYGKAAGSAFETAIGGRLYKGWAPEGKAYPYAVYMVVTDAPDHVFAKDGDEALIQFSVFSSASSSAEVEDIVGYLRALYDDCALTVTGHVVIRFAWQNTTPGDEDHTTPDGTVHVWAYHVEYLVTRQKS